MKRAVVHRAVAEERHRNAIGLEQLETVARASGLENAGPHNPACAHQTNLRREQMHAAAATARTAGLASVKFGEELAGVESLGQRVAMSAVGAENHVFAAKMCADAGSDSLLPNIGVARAVDESALM